MSIEKQAKKRFCADNKDLSNIIEFVHEFLDSCLASQKIKKQIELAIEEMAVNIIHYAYESGSGPIDIEMIHDKTDQLQIEITDWGEKFDPTRLGIKENTPENVEEVEEGGLGIYLANQVMDLVQYQRFGTENHLLMKKHF